MTILKANKKILNSIINQFNVEGLNWKKKIKKIKKKN